MKSIIEFGDIGVTLAFLRSQKSVLEDVNVADRSVPIVSVFPKFVIGLNLHSRALATCAIL